MGIAYDDTKLIAVSDHATVSAEGKTWKKISAAFDGAVRNLGYVSGKFWAVGSGDQSSNLKYSTNGAYWTNVINDWTKRSIADIACYLNYMTYIRHFITVGDEIHYSTDGTTWTKAAVTPKYPLNAIAATRSLALAVGGSPGISYMLRSTDE
jgi:hypothetical protein